MYYTPDIAQNPILPEDEAAHAIRVMRLSSGAEITLTDGKGNIYDATILQADIKRCLLQINSCTPYPPPPHTRTHIALAPTKNLERTEWFCEKATEIGISEITFLKCRYSERRDVKMQRMEKVLVSAMKQSQRPTLPTANPIVDFTEFTSLPFHGQKFIAHCEAGDKTLLKNAFRPGSDALVLIGPEGDFSHEEINLAVANGFQPVSLGESRLRTETAALIACHTIILGRMS